MTLTYGTPYSVLSAREMVFARDFADRAAGMDAPLTVLVLNYNGRSLLEECLPSVRRGVAASRRGARLIVVDNDSTDDSLAWLAEQAPDVEVWRSPNRGLCTFNDVLERVSSPVVLLLNNDIKLAVDALDPLTAPFFEPGGQRCFLTAPHCLRFDDQTYEGFRTAVAWRWGLVQATALFPGHEARCNEPGLTASAGAALAVDRVKFLELGGFDPLYLPGRIEDVDLAYRAAQRGWQCRYVPASRAWHRGQATFDASLGSAASLELALRNTLLFQWKHLRHPLHVARQLVGLPLRVARELLLAPGQPRERRWLFCRALVGAMARAPRALGSSARERTDWRRERNWFQTFHPRRMGPRCEASSTAARHPLSRWTFQPLAEWLAARLVSSRVRPSQITTLGLGFALAAMVWIVLGREPVWLAALLVSLSWLCDRTDGALARRQRTASAWGAWYDANVDELIDVGLHVALAARLAATEHVEWPWWAAIAFITGKYLFFHGRGPEAHPHADEPPVPSLAESSLLRRLYHAPGNTDLRIHALLVALLTETTRWELLAVAVYYNLRWIVRSARLTLRPGVWEPSGVAR